MSLQRPLRRCSDWLRKRRLSLRQRRELQQLNAYLLRDVGLCRPAGSRLQLCIETPAGKASGRHCDR